MHCDKVKVFFQHTKQQLGRHYPHADTQKRWLVTKILRRRSAKKLARKRWSAVINVQKNAKTLVQQSALSRRKVSLFYPNLICLARNPSLFSKKQALGIVFLHITAHVFFIDEVLLRHLLHLADNVAEKCLWIRHDVFSITT